jgi:hypothetical protein
MQLAFGEDDFGIAIDRLNFREQFFELPLGFATAGLRVNDKNRWF